MNSLQFTPRQEIKGRRGLDKIFEQNLHPQYTVAKENLGFLLRKRIMGQSYYCFRIVVLGNDPKCPSLLGPLKSVDLGEMESNVEVADNLSEADPLSSLDLELLESDFVQEDEENLLPDSLSNDVSCISIADYKTEKEMDMFFVWISSSDLVAILTGKINIETMSRIQNPDINLICGFQSNLFNLLLDNLRLL